MSQDKHTVRVKIYGTEYPIQAEADPAYIQKIAQYVDERMHEIPGDSTKQSLVVSTPAATKRARWPVGSPGRRRTGRLSSDTE